MNKSNLRVSLNAVDANKQASTSTLTRFIQNLPDSPSMDSTQMDRIVPRNCKQHIILPYPVDVVGKSRRAVPFLHEDFSKLQILSRLLSAKFLRREIREKGSAYGSGARVTSGLLTLYSYRDPNNTNTLKVFNSACSRLGFELPDVGARYGRSKTASIFRDRQANSAWGQRPGLLPAGNFRRYGRNVQEAVTVCHLQGFA